MHHPRGLVLIVLPPSQFPPRWHIGLSMSSGPCGYFPTCNNYVCSNDDVLGIGVSSLHYFVLGILIPKIT